MKTVDFSETIAASDLKVGRSRHLIEFIAASDLQVGRCRQLIDFMKVFEYWRSRSFFTIYIPGFLCFVFY